MQLVVMCGPFDIYMVTTYACIMPCVLLAIYFIIVASYILLLG